MGIADRLKEATKKAEEAATEHKDQIRQAVQKAEAVADERTGGKYRDQIQKAAAKADTVVDRIPDPDAGQRSEPGTQPPGASAVEE